MKNPRHRRDGQHQRPPTDKANYRREKKEAQYTLSRESGELYPKPVQYWGVKTPSHENKLQHAAGAYPQVLLTGFYLQTQNDDSHITPWDLHTQYLYYEAKLRCVVT